MTFLALFLLPVVAQLPAPEPEDPFVRRGLEADLRATESGLQRPAVRLTEVMAPALAQGMLATPAQAARRVEGFVREALVEIRPVPLLRAAITAFAGGRREPDPRISQPFDLRRFEAALERAHREIVRALGSGRDPAMQAPHLQAVIERHLQPGVLDQASESERSALRTVLGRAAKVDHVAMGNQALAILAVADALAAAAGSDPGPLKPGERGVTGTVVLDHSTPFGRFVVGGPGRNEYECAEVAVIVDLGGDDEYRGPVAGAGVSRRMSVVVDLSGDDTYRGGNDALGSAVFGVGVLVDCAGDDHYQAGARGGGFGAAGVGVLIDLAGEDEYEFGHDGGGVGLAGIGLFLDAGAGKDVSHVGPRSLGCGLPGGVGFFIDDGGDDLRSSASGDAVQPLSCGVGYGVARWLAGGLGLFVDVDGADRYECGDASCGAGIAGGVGVCFDIAGRDHYAAGELALGGARAYGIGIFLEAAGDDEYRLRGPSLGCAFERGVGWAEERSGQDTYQLAGTWPGWADGGALGVFLEFAGRDGYTLAARPLGWRASDDKVTALALYEDRGGDADTYSAGEHVRAPRNGEVDRQVGAGAAGQVVRVLADR